MLPGAGDMMSEMARKLQERRRKADEGASSGEPTTTEGSEKKPWERGNGSNTNGNGGNTNKFSNGAGAESPRLGRNKRFQSLTGQENIAAMVTANGGSGAAAAAAATNNQTPENMDAFKQEILQEMKREIQKAKLDIIEAIKMELNRR